MSDEQKPEKIITMEVTAREAHMIKIIRDVSFGDIVVRKFDGKPIRVEPKSSYLITEEGVKLSNGRV